MDKKQIPNNSFNTLIIGGGPAGSGLFMKSIKDGTLNQLLSGGLCLIEASDRLVSGQLDRYMVNSDTHSNVFLECLEGRAKDTFKLDRLKDGIDTFNEYADKSIPLNKTGVLLDPLGLQLIELIDQHPSSFVAINTEAEEVHENQDGGYRIITKDHQIFQAKKIVIACGGRPRSSQLDLKYQNKAVHSDDVIKSKAEFSKLNPGDSIIIVGGSHSAFSAAHYLLENHEPLISATQPIEIWANEPPKIYFPSPEIAHAAKYEAFTEDDVCPLTNRVYRLAGLRMDGRELFMNMLGINDVVQEKRVVLKIINKSEGIPSAVLDEANLIIEATGYNFNMPKFYNQKKERMSFLGEKSFHWVNDDCQLVLANGEALSKVFAIGLASGFLPSGELGGEKSFHGQANGIWYYQNLIANIILKQLHENTPIMP